MVLPLANNAKPEEKTELPDARTFSRFKLTECNFILELNLLPEGNAISY